MVVSKIIACVKVKDHTHTQYEAASLFGNAALFLRSKPMSNRNYKHSIEQSKQKNPNWIDNIKHLPVVPKVCLYIFLMAIIGAGMGELKYRLEAANCLNDYNCWTIEPAERQARELGVGAIAGIFAATLISIPALLND